MSRSGQMLIGAVKFREVQAIVFRRSSVHLDILQARPDTTERLHCVKLLRVLLTQTRSICHKVLHFKC